MIVLLKECMENMRVSYQNVKNLLIADKIKM